MDDGDVLVTISDGAGGGAATPKPLTLADLTAVHGPRVPVGNSLTRGTFCFAARCLGIQVDFGAARPPDDLERPVDEVLASLAATAP